MVRDPRDRDEGPKLTEEEWATTVLKANHEEAGTGEDGYGVYLPMFPYLPLHEPVLIDNWHLVPFNFVRPSVLNDVDREVALALEAYRPAVEGYDFGVVCVPAAADADPALPEDLLRPLSQAVLAAMLFANPRLGEHDIDCDCRIAGTTTSENAQLIVVALGAEFIHSRSGSRIARTMTLLRTPGKAYTIPPPEALYLPNSATDLDGKLATRIYRTLLHEGEVGRRIDNAIAWLDFIAANGTSVVPSVRIMALRTAFEALFGETRTVQLRGFVGDLLSPADAKLPRSWQDNGRTRTDDLSDREWWFQRFSLLRNSLTHGTNSEDDAWVHEGLPHSNLAQEALVEAIAAMANASEGEEKDA